MKLTEQQKQNLCKLIEKSLKEATLKNWRDAVSDNEYPLIEHLCSDDFSIEKGKEEIEHIVEQVYFDMDDNDWDI